MDSAFPRWLHESRGASGLQRTLLTAVSGRLICCPPALRGGRGRNELFDERSGRVLGLARCADIDCRRAQDSCSFQCSGELRTMFCSVACAEGVGVAGVGEYVGSATQTRGRRESDFHSRSSLWCSRCLRSLALLFQVSILWIPQLGSSLHSRVLVEETVVVGVSAVMMEDGTEVSTTITGGRSQDGCLKKGSALIATLVLFDRDHAFLVHFDLHVNFNHDSLPDIFEESHDKDMARAATASHAAPCHEIEPTGNGLECSDGFNPIKT
ncbi:hypothetical protein GW17_00041866 [Ensete ventricosum]|nr:hypothetical protein GW17_00041866 [Ensete ventricosum]